MHSGSGAIQSGRAPCGSRQETRAELLRFLTCGSVDDGKSTLIGRLLYDTKLLFDDQLAGLEDAAPDGTRDYASLLDGLEAEREQGITIDVAYRFFATPARRFIVADTPGHEQYTRNMATGASTADLAVILVDARKGVLTQTRRHATIASLMGISRIVLAVNKMDLVAYAESIFEDIAVDFADAVAHLGSHSIETVPISAMTGDNVVSASPQMPWYKGLPLLGMLEAAQIDTVRRPFRYLVQWVNRPHQDFRGFAGTVVGGRLAPGERVCVTRTGEAAGIARIVTMDGDRDACLEGDAVTLTLDREIDVSRGDLLCGIKDGAEFANQLAADIIWMNKAPLIPGRPYLFKVGRTTLAGNVTDIRYRLDVDKGEHLAAKTLALNEIGRCNVDLAEPVAFDPYEANRLTGSFIVIDRFSFETVGAGMIRFALRRAENVHWQALTVDRAARAVLLGQRPRMIWFTGLSGSGKSTIANLVECKLHAMGRHTYILDGDNVRHGLNRDLGFTDADRVENIRRIVEVGRLMMDAGLIVIASFISPFRAERQMARDYIGEDFIEVFVKTPLETAEARDPKGLYAKARAGELKNFTGIDSPYEPPSAPELSLDTTMFSAEALAERVVAKICAAGWD